MDSPSPLSFRAAQAYGLPNARAPITQQTTGRIERGRIVPPFNPAAAAATAAETEAATRRDTVSLIAGQVNSPLMRGEGFDQSSTASSTTSRNPGGNFAMYSRAADRIEVATKVTLGKSLDARG